MDAVVFLKEKRRMCDTFLVCSSCPLCGLDKLDGVLRRHLCPDIFYREAEEAVSIVEKWSKEHPIKTNSERFEEVFGSNTGLIKIVRNHYNGKIVYFTVHEDVLLQWLDAPYEEPKEE